MLARGSWRGDVRAAEKRAQWRRRSALGGAARTAHAAPDVTIGVLTTSVTAFARSENDALADRRSLAVVVLARGSWRSDVRAVEKRAHWRRRSVLAGAAKTAHAAPDVTISVYEELGGARSRNDVLTARLPLAVVVLARGSWRGDVRAAEKCA